MYAAMCAIFSQYAFSRQPLPERGGGVGTKDIVSNPPTLRGLRAPVLDARLAPFAHGVDDRAVLAQEGIAHAAEAGGGAGGGPVVALWGGAGVAGAGDVWALWVVVVRVAVVVSVPWPGRGDIAVVVFQVFLVSVVAEGGGGACVQSIPQSANVSASTDSWYRLPG